MTPQAKTFTEFLTPVGRYVGGDLFEVQDNGNFGNGTPARTQAGEEKKQYVVVMAFPKMVPNPQTGQLEQNAEFFRFWQVLQQTGQAAFPHLGQIPPFWDPACRFAWKIQDGDGRDGNGNPNASKAGYAGHWIVKFASMFQPKCYYVGRHSPHEQITDANVIPRGHYIRIAGTTQGNGQAQKPGVYVNVSLVEYIGGSQSDVINVGPSAAAAFAQAPTLLPGMQAIMPSPQMAQPGGLPMPGSHPQQMQPQGMPGVNPQAMPGAQIAGLPAVGMPSSGVQPMGMPGPGGYAGPAMTSPSSMPGMPGVQQAAPLAVQPNPGFLNGPGGAVAGQGYPPSPMPGVSLPAPGAIGTGMSPSSPRMTAAAQGYSYQQLIEAGHTDATLRAQGLML